MAHAQRYISLFVVMVLAACSDPVETLKKGEECDGCEIKNADFSGHKFTQSLKDITFVNTNLSGADFSSTGKQFTGKQFRVSNVRFEKSNLDGANFSGINIRAKFKDSSLKGAIFDNANFYGDFLTSIDKSDASKASFLNAEGKLSSSFNSFRGANFSNSYLRLKFYCCSNDLAYANFFNARVRWETPGEEEEDILKNTTIKNANLIKNIGGLTHGIGLTEAQEKKLRDAAGRAYDRNCAKSSYGC